MNVFDLAGPQFLVFYLFLACAALFVLVLWRNQAEPRDPPPMNLADPYLIAFLRGGKNELLRVTTIALIDRGFLNASGSIVAVHEGVSGAPLRIPIEQRVFAHFVRQAEAASIFNETVDKETRAYEEELIRLDLLPGPDRKAARRKSLAIVIGVLWGVALVKLGVAYLRGRSNVEFLIILAIFSSVAAMKLGRPRLTGRGSAMISALRTLFQSLKQRASTLLPGSNPNEVLLLCAVYGASAIPATSFPFVKRLYPQATSDSSSSSGSSCGSSCGSGCGGGGCSGGCGGCGS